MFITLPIIFPVIEALGFDPIWFGVIIVVIMEMGLITPPVGLNVFGIAGVAKDIPMSTIFRGIIPFVGPMIIALTILILFPQIALFLPNMLK
jgi:TRAP-type C4-dicarboxylate transport system permease large subunit